MAVDFLRRQGAEILDRNARGGCGELDIVACLGDVLLFVEVKAHREMEGSLAAMTAGKQRRLVSAARAWLARHPARAVLQCRFDLIMVSSDSNDVIWYEDAFRP